MVPPAAMFDDWADGVRAEIVIVIRPLAAGSVADEDVPGCPIRALQWMKFAHGEAAAGIVPLTAMFSTGPPIALPSVR